MQSVLKMVVRSTVYIMLVFYCTFYHLMDSHIFLASIYDVMMLLDLQHNRGGEQSVLIHQSQNKSSLSF